MGSGCSSNNSTSNWFGKPNIQDKKVEYTGPPIPGLGICTHDTLAEVEAVVLQAILNYSTGVGINLPDVDLTTCALFTQYVTCCDTACTDLPCLMNIIFTSLCTLYTDFTTLQAEVTALLNGPYDKGCLTLGSNPTLTQIIQELIIEFCSLKSQVSTLQTQVTTLSAGITTTIGNFLNSALSSCQHSGLVKSGTGSSFTASFKGFVPIGSIIPYVGVTAGLFDSTGLGITGTDACGWALANGNNSTYDFRGFVPVGAINGMGGGALDARVVDAGASPSAVYSLGDTVGQIRHQLLGAEVPSVGVTGSLNDPGHDHGIQYQHQERKISNGGVDNYIDFSGAMTAQTPWTENPSGAVHPAFPSSGDAGKVLKNKTGITVDTLSTTGGNGLHENRQPSKALYFIQRIS